MQERKLDWASVRYAVEDLREKIAQKTHLITPKVYGVPRGGSMIAAMLGYAVDTPEEADIIVDDLIDSGATKAQYAKLYPNKPFMVAYEKDLIEGSWIVFPWEQDSAQDVKENVTRILQYIGEDVKREGLQETPKRFLKLMKEVCTPKEFEMTTFKNEGMDEMIIQKNIPFYSLCEHHLAPFFGTAVVAYIPDEKIVGLSKLARTVEKFAARPQNQERITQQVAEYLTEQLNPKGVAVILKARHLCVEMRGIKKPGTETITSCMKGVFKTDMNCRQEFLKLSC